MDAIADRDGLAELMFTIALCGIHLSRLAEDLILWCTSEFGFVTLSDAHTTGSSLMPQKKNPDIAELTRGKSGRLLGNLVSLLTAIKGLPLTYNRDLQEDKEPLFDSIDTIRLALQINAEMIGGMKVNVERCRAAAADPLLLATDLADYLVQRGVPFRHAHELVGQAVAESLRSGIPLDRLDLPAISPHFGADAAAVFNLDRALDARTNPGAPSPANIAAAIHLWEETLG
jgi:argininosuccinate lyase